MQATRALNHFGCGEPADAARWVERAAHAPGAHVLIAMIAAAVQWIAGDRARARAWADNVRSRSPELGREDFFRAFPIRDPTQRRRIAQTLERLGF